MANKGIVFIFIVAFLSSKALAQLKELSIELIENPTQSIPVFRNYPEAAAIIASSPIKNLKFDSNIGLIADLSEPEKGEYRLILEPYRQVITVNAPNFMQTRFTVTVNTARDVDFYFIQPVMNNKKVLIRVDQGAAKLFINDTEYEHFEEPIEIPLGLNSLKIIAKGFKSIEEVIEVSNDTPFFEYEMERIEPEIVTVTTNPPLANVFLDGIEIGKTDELGRLQLFRVPGDYTIMVSRSGYMSLSDTISVAEGSDNNYSFEIEKTSGAIEFRVQPDTASIYVNNKQVENRKTIDFAPGVYKIEYKSDGYESVSEYVDIVKGETIQKSISLVREMGSMQFSVTPSFAQVYLKKIDGQEYDNWIGLKFFDQIPTGTYLYHVEADSYQSAQKSFIIEKDMHQLVNVSLERDPNSEVDIEKVNSSLLDDASEKAYRVVDSPPTLIGGQASIQDKIQYPEFAKASGIDGRVLIELTVGKDGKVINPKIIQSVGGGCDQEALRVVRLARFTPGKHKGETVNVRITVPIDFWLN